MEFVNEYILLNSQATNDNSESKLSVVQDHESIIFNFNLNVKDCLFELLDQSYLFEITISKSYFEKYNEPLEMIIDKQSICCNTQAKLLEIINCNLIGLQRNIYLESIVLFLIYQSQRNNYVFQMDCSSCTVINKPIELEKIQEANRYILSHLDESLTIPQIAQQVGTNQCYLKKGFKEYYQQTIYEFIQENRMVKANSILQEGKVPLSLTATLVGYSSLSSFSNAYKNYFGVTPKEHLKEFQKAKNYT